MNKNKLSWLLGAVLGVALVAGTPGAIFAQTSPEIIAQSSELQEAERLNQQVIQLYQQGNYPEAISLAEKVLAIYEKALGSDHPDVAKSLNNLATLYNLRGNYTRHGQKLRFFYQTAFVNGQLLIVNGKEATINH